MSGPSTRSTASAMLSGVRTVFTVLQQTAHTYRGAIALHQPTGRKVDRNTRRIPGPSGSVFLREIACGLHSLGLAKGGIVCTLSETRAEFYLADLGVMGAGGVSAALYTSYPIAEQAKTLATIRPEFLFVENPKTVSALAEFSATIAHRISSC